MTDTNHIADSSKKVSANRLSTLRETIINYVVNNGYCDWYGVEEAEKVTDAIMQAFGRETDRLVAEMLAKLPEKYEESEYGLANYERSFNDAIDKIAALIGSYKQEEKKGSK